MTCRASAWLCRMVVLAAATIIAGPVAAQQFSAEMVATGGGPSERQRIYQSDSKTRMEPEDGSGMAMIADNAAGTIYMINQRLHVYVDMSRMPGMPQGLGPIDPANACPQWQKMMNEMARMPGAPRPPPGQAAPQWSCRRIGPETVNGRPAIRYEAVSPDGEKGSIWIDPRLKFALKVAGPDGGMELQRIAEAPQAPSLFEVPPGYRETDMRQMMQQMPPPGGRPPPMRPPG